MKIKIKGDQMDTYYFLICIIQDSFFTSDSSIVKQLELNVDEYKNTASKFTSCRINDIFGFDMHFSDVKECKQFVQNYVIKQLIL